MIFIAAKELLISSLCCCIKRVHYYAELFLPTLGTYFRKGLKIQEQFRFLNKNYEKSLEIVG